MSIIGAYLRLVGRWRWSLLLALLVGGVLLQPLAPPSRLADLVTVALALLILGGAIRAGRAGPLVARSAAGLLSMAFALELLSFLGVGGLDGILAGLMLLIVVAAMVATFAELIGGRQATIDGLIGAIFGYVLIAAVWSLLFRRLDVWQPGSFALADGRADIQYLYFSLITITTVGYGDVLPVSPVARIWSALEAVTGTLYIAVLIGRIVGELRLGNVGAEALSRQALGTRQDPGRRA